MDAAWSPFWLGLRAAALSTAVAMALGPFLAFLVFRRPTPLSLVDLPAGIAIPLMAAYALLAPAFQWPMAALASLAFSLPYFIRSSAVAYERLNPDYWSAARLSGASEWRIFQRIAAPLAWRSILRAAVFAFGSVSADYAAILLLARAVRTAGGLATGPFLTSLGFAVALHYAGSLLEVRRATI